METFNSMLRIVFRENYGYSNEYQSVDIRVLLDQHVQRINNYNVLAQAPNLPRSCSCSTI